MSSRGELRGHEVFLERSLVSLPLQLIGLITVLPTKPVFVDKELVHGSAVHPRG